MPSTHEAVRLRLDRASKHLVEIQGLITKYAHSEPYAVRHGVEGKKKEHVYRLCFTKQPPEQIAVVAGDFFHNLRSALNYLMAGLVPASRKRDTQFPIFTEDPFARDQITGDYVKAESDQRDLWTRYVKGVHPKALAYIESIQPYNRPRKSGQHDLLAVLNRLSNADKHYEMTVTPQGLEDGWVTVVTEGGATERDLEDLVAQDGTEIFRSPTPVEVHVEGTPEVLIRIGPDLLVRAGSLIDMRLYVGGAVVAVLSPYLRR